jgi:hypothetical protein
MKRYRLLFFIAFCPSMVQQTFGQTPTKTESALPRLVRFGGMVKDLDGRPPAGVVGITFALYSEQSGGAPLWLETQNVNADSNGHYNVLLGSTKPDGLAADLFTSEQAHWVGVQIEGQPEQPRVLLVSAPYALKAGDSETLGGLPASAFMLAGSPAGPAPAGSVAPVAPRVDVSPAQATDVTTTGGGANYLPFFTGTSSILDSVIYQSGTGSAAKVGVNTTTPAATLDVEGGGIIRGALRLPAPGAATAAAGVNSQTLNLVASVFNSGTGAAVPETFQLQAQPVGNDTATPSAALSVLYGSGTGTPAQTGLQIASNGVVTFASGQTFPGTGSITGVTAGTDLTGGGNTGAVTLNLDTTRVPQLAAANTFTANQTVNGIVTATSFSGNGSGLTNLPGATDIPCAGAPGNTTAAYRQQCQTSAGAVYACNNSAGCAVASDWVTAVTSVSGTANQICASAGTGAVLLSICNPFIVTQSMTVNNATNRYVGSTITINGENYLGNSSPFVLGNAGWDSTAVPYIRPAIANLGNGSPFYILPNGNTTNAWIEIFSTDLFADAIDFESLTLLKYPNGPASIGTNSGGTGSVRNLIIQDPAYAPGGQTCVACTTPLSGTVLDIAGETRSQGTLWAYTNAIVGPNENTALDTLDLAPTPRAGAVLGQLHIWNSSNVSGTGSSIDFTNATGQASISTQIVSVANFGTSTGYGCGSDSSNSDDFVFLNQQGGSAKQILTLCGDQNIEVGGSTPNPGSALTVASGDVYVASPSAGVIMKDTATGTCYRVQITSGALVPTALGSCPSF